MLFAITVVFLTSVLAMDYDLDFSSDNPVYISTTEENLRETSCLKKYMARAYKSLFEEFDQECLSYNCKLKNDWSKITLISCEKPKISSNNILCYPHKYADSISDSAICCSKVKCVMVKASQKIIQIPGKLAEGFHDELILSNDMIEKSFNADVAEENIKVIKKRETTFYTEKGDILNSRLKFLTQNKFKRENSKKKEKHISKNNKNNKNEEEDLDGYEEESFYSDSKSKGSSKESKKEKIKNIEKTKKKIQGEDTMKKN